MRTIRRVVTLGIGAAAGATAVYLLDPASGRQRRREVLRTAAQRARQRAVNGRASATPPRQRVSHGARTLAARAAAAYRDEQERREGLLAAGSNR